MATKTFVKIGDRVTIYEDPYSMKKVEGKARIVDVHEQSDDESAYVDVHFDSDHENETYLTYSRWVLPQHMEKQNA